MAWSERFKYGKPNNTDEKQIGIRYWIVRAVWLQYTPGKGALK